MLLMADNINQELREWRKAKRLTQQEAGELLGISRAYFANLEYGQSIPDHVREALDKFGFGTESYPRIAAPTISVRGVPMVKIPVIGVASAGSGEPDVDDEDDELEVPLFMTYPGCQGFRVKGDSMHPAIRPTDTVVIRLKVDLFNGKTYLFQKDGKFFLKKLKWSRGYWWMHSINPSIEDMSTLDVTVIGMLTGIYSEINGEITTRSKFEGLDIEELLE
jgi:SOS-response transcriptional repressor LexA